MFTKEFSILNRMTEITKEQNLDYKILYSYKQINRTNNHTESYSVMLCTSLYTVTFTKNFEPNDTFTIKQFLDNNNAISLNCEIRISDNQVELS